MYLIITAVRLLEKTYKLVHTNTTIDTRINKRNLFSFKTTKMDEFPRS